MTGSQATLEDLPALRAGVHDGSLELLYQPEVELDTGALVAMEGLLRWHHAELGVLAPPAFLDMAERAGELGPIGRWVLHQGAREARSWSTLPGKRRRLWLNVSAGQVDSAELPDLVREVLAEHGLPGDALGLEVTERTVLDLGDRAREVLQRLRDTGVALAIDDFASWRGTLGVIADLPVDVVKLDQRYVRSVGEDVAGESDLDAVVETLVAQAHDHGMLVVAEGVEAWSEAVRLTELGCDRAHGWLFARALPAQRARSLLARGAGWRAAVGDPATGSAPAGPAPTLQP